MAQGELYRLRKKDVSATSALMCRAYRADPLALALVPEESNRARFLPSVFEFLSRYGILYGESWRLFLRAVEELDEYHEKAIRAPHWYLGFMAVDPPFQGKGHGSVLMRAKLERVDQEPLPCYLETFNERSVHFYERHGFGIVKEIRALGCAGVAMMRGPIGRHGGNVIHTGGNPWTRRRRSS